MPAESKYPARVRILPQCFARVFMHMLATGVPVYTAVAPFRPGLTLPVL